MTKLIHDIATAFDIIQLLKFKITVKTFSILVLHQLFFSPQNKDLDVIPWKVKRKHRQTQCWQAPLLGGSTDVFWRHWNAPLYVGPLCSDEWNGYWCSLNKRLTLPQQKQVLSNSYCLHSDFPDKNFTQKEHTNNSWEASSVNLLDNSPAAVMPHVSFLRSVWYGCLFFIALLQAYL